MSSIAPRRKLSLARVGALAAASVVAGGFLAPITANAVTLVQASNVQVSPINGNYGSLTSLHNCTGGDPAVVDSSSSSGDYSFENATNNTKDNTNDPVAPSQTGNATGGLHYSFGFPVPVSNFQVTVTAPAPAQPSGVPAGTYGTTFPPLSRHVDELTAQNDYGCNASDFTVLNYLIKFNIGGTTWEWSPASFNQSAPNEVTLGFLLGGSQAVITSASLASSGTITYTYQCQLYSCGFSNGQHVNIANLGSSDATVDFNANNVAIGNVTGSTFTVATGYSGKTATSNGQGAVSLTSGLSASSMDLYVANVVNPPAGVYPGIDYSVLVNDQDLSSANIYSSVPAPATSGALTYSALSQGDPTTSSLSIDKASISATNVPGQGATVTATVRDQYYNPIQNAEVYIGVLDTAVGGVFTAPTSTTLGPDGLPQTAADGTVTFHAWGTKSTELSTPDTFFAHVHIPGQNDYYIQREQQIPTDQITSASVTTTTESSTLVNEQATYYAQNTFVPGQLVSVSGLPVASDGEDLNFSSARVTAATNSSFTVSLNVAVVPVGSGHTFNPPDTTSALTCYNPSYQAIPCQGNVTSLGLQYDISSASATSSVISFYGPFHFSAGDTVEISGLQDCSSGCNGSSIVSDFSATVLSSFSGGFTTANTVGLSTHPYGDGTATASGLVTALLTGGTASGGTVTYDASNNFQAGQRVTISDLAPFGDSNFNVTNDTIVSATSSQFVVQDFSVGDGSFALNSSQVSIATATGPADVSMAIVAATPLPASQGGASQVQACAGGSECFGAGVSVSNITVGTDAVVTVKLVDQFGNPDMDKAVTLAPLQPQPPAATVDFSHLSITPLRPADGSDGTHQCNTGPTAHLPGISCTDETGTTSFLVTDTKSQTVSFQIFDATDGFTMPTTDLAPTDVPNIPVVGFITGPTSPNASTVSVNGGTTANIAADGAHYGTVTVTLRDQYGNPEVNSAGHAVSVSLAGTTGGPVSVSAASGDGHQITYLASNTDNPITITSASGDGTTATFEAPNNNLTVGELVSITGLGVASGSSLDLTNVAVTSANTSKFTVASSVQGVSSGTGQALHGFAVGQSVTITGFTGASAQFNLTSAVVTSSTPSQFTVASSIDATATGTGSVSPDEHDVIAANSGSNCASPGSSGNTDSNGQISFRVCDASLETVQYTATFTDPTQTLSLTNAGQQPVVNFTTSQVSYANSSVVVSPSTVVGSGRGTANVTVTILDGGSHPLAGENVSLDPSDPATVTAATGDGTTVTYSAANNYTVGQRVSIVGLGTISGSSLDLSDVIVTNATSTSFQITDPTVGVASGSGTATLYYRNLTIVPPQQQTDANGQVHFSVTAGAFDSSITLPTEVYVPVEVSPAPLNGHTPIASTLTANITFAPTPVTNHVSAQPTVNQETVTGTSTSSGEVTYDASNVFTPGQVVTITGLTSASGDSLNLTNVVIHSVSPTSFTVLTNAVGTTTGTGVAQVSTPVANGSLDESITASVFDATSNPIPNLSLELVTSDGTVVGTQNTDGSGQANFTAGLPTTQPDLSVTYIVKDLSDGGRVVGVVPVTYVPKADEADESTVTASPTTVFTYDPSLQAAHAAQQTSTVTVTLIDPTGAPIAGHDVRLSATPGANATVDGSPGSGDALTNANGVASFAVADCNPNGGTSCAPADVTGASGDGTTVTYDSTNSFVVGQTVSISGLSIVSGSSLNLFNVKISAVTASTFSVLSPVVGMASVPSASVSSAVGDGTTITYDAANGFSPGQTVTVTGLGVASGSPLNLVDATIATATPSQFTVASSLVGSSSGTGVASAPASAVPLPKAETVTFSAVDESTLPTTPIVKSAQVNFVVRPNEALASTVTSNSPIVEADGTHTATVTVTLDNNGDALVGNLVSLSQGSGHAIITTANPVSDAHGVVNFVVRDLTSQPVVFEATDVTTATTIQNVAIVNFTAPPGGTLQPSVTSISPSNGPGAGGTLVTITGTNLVGATGVFFGGVPSPTFSANLAGTTLYALSPIPVAAGSVHVMVTGPGGSSTLSSSDIFTYTSVPPFVVRAVFPQSGAISGGTTVTIQGSGLINATAVKFGAISAHFVVTNEGQTLEVIAPASNVAGQVPVVVVTPKATSSPSPTTTFTFLGSTPHVSSTPSVLRVSPSAGPLRGGNLVAITGSGFAGARYVTFAGVRTAVLSVNRAGTIVSVRAPKSRYAGTVNVVVVTGTGHSTTTRADAYRYVATPAKVVRPHTAGASS